MTTPAISPEELLGPFNEVEAKHAPKHLFTAGDLGILESGARVSIVGSRDASPGGISRATKLARILADRAIVVVSGLAAGIDTAAHTASIDAGGKTIAVLGTPLDRFYPKENRRLQERIMQDHLVLSEFPLGAVVRPGNFPIRNRTMALISDATVIIEASDESGSLHQAWEAFRLGRPLLFAKANLDRPELTWPEKLLHYGALVLSDDSLEEFLTLLPERPTPSLDASVSL
jgi:DNA processing protein